MKALLLHPSLALREQFATALLRRGHGVSAFSDTADAFAAFAHGAFPLVIAGGPDAAGFCRHLRTLPGGADAHVLAIDTAEHACTDALLGAGADNVLAEDAPDALVDRHLGIAERLLSCDAQAMTPASQAALLQRVAEATSEFLGAAPFYEAFRAAVGRIGQAVDVDRVYLFEHHPHPQTGEPAISQRAEWVDDPDLAEIDNPAMIDLPYQAAGLDRMLHDLRAGRPFGARVRRAPPSRNASCSEPQSILSLLVMPVSVFGGYWGSWASTSAGQSGNGAHRTAQRWRCIACHAVGRALERERATDELRKSEERFRSLVSEISDIVYRHDLGGVLTEVNEAALEFTGYAREEIIGRDFADVVHPDSVEPGRQRTQQKVAGEAEVTRFEVSVVKKDGSVVPIEVSSRLVYEDGQPVAVQGIGRDVSHRHQYEEALRQAEARQRALVAALPDFVFRVRGDGTILDYKPGAGARLYRAPEDAIGLNLFEDIDPGNAELRRAALQQAHEKWRARANRLHASYVRPAAPLREPDRGHGRGRSRDLRPGDDGPGPRGAGAAPVRSAAAGAGPGIPRLRAARLAGRHDPRLPPAGGAGGAAAPGKRHRAALLRADVRRGSRRFGRPGDGVGARNGRAPARGIRIGRTGPRLLFRAAHRRQRCGRGRRVRPRGN
ncbi:MAG: PAS domain S-box protein [Dehalococcoidia bacterium]|nr:PAS domain S-box protein [Dehalococcoidia bacterium]